jgi:hypothetical protein
MAEFDLRPFCNVCGWRKGGLDSWDGTRCKCGHSSPPIELIGENRIIADRWWRDPERHVVFQRATGWKEEDRNIDEYHREFRLWALSLIHASNSANG